MKAQDKVTIDDKLFTVAFKHAKEGHLKILKPKVCIECEEKWCTTICPANVYHWDEEKQEIIISWENCLEMSVCISACRFGNIEFTYPKGGKGVEFRYG